MSDLCDDCLLEAKNTPIERGHCIRLCAKCSLKDAVDFIDKQPLMEKINNELFVWRKYFLDQKFSNKLKVISTNNKEFLSSYFLSYPSGSIIDPQEAWGNCLSTLIEKLGNK